MTNIDRRITGLAQIELRASDGKNVLVGYAAKFNSPSNDLGGFIETIHPRAFDESLAEDPDVSARVQHEGGLATVGRTRNRTLKLSVDKVGLRYEAIVPNTQAGRDIIELVRNGYIDKSSFAFSLRPGGERWDLNAVPAQRELLNINLHDVSPVDSPAYESTSVAVRSLAAARMSAGFLVKEKTAGVAKKEDVPGLTAEQAFRNLPSAAPSPSALERRYVQYLISGNTFSPADKLPETAPELTRHAYRIHITFSGEAIFEKIRPQTDELYRFKNSVMEEVLREIDRFWDLKQDYANLGVMHNRGIMLHGPPGSGKTSAMNQVAEMIVERGDVVFYGKGISSLCEGLRAFREIESDRKAVVVLEDCDEYVGYQEQAFLNLLDGERSVDGILYLGSTNYINAFPPRLLRSGRFDKRVYVGPPPYEGRLAYLAAKLKDIEADKEIERLAKATDGMSFGDLRELITAGYALKEPIDDVLARLSAIQSPSAGDGKRNARATAPIEPRAEATPKPKKPVDLNDYLKQKFDYLKTLKPAK